MWWDKLETEINNIIGGYKQENTAPSRTEREILEEVLELTRMNASRPRRRSKMSHSIVYDLMDVIEEVSRMSTKYGDKRSFILMDRLRSPIKHLCMELDEPELYEKFMHRMKRSERISHQERMFLDKESEENNT